MLFHRSQRRLFALTGCVLFLASGLLARQHQASTDHGYCSEHGELVHLHDLVRHDLARHDLARHDLAQGTTNASLPARSAVLPTIPIEGVHGCLALHLLVTPFLSGGDVIVTPLHAAQKAQQRGSRQGAHTPIAILLTAPKNSPPRV